MKKFSLIGTALASILFASSSIAQSEFKIGSGSNNNTYSNMVNDVITYCDESIADKQLNNVNSKGSVENLVGMGNKTFNAGLVQEDVLQYYHKRNPNKVNNNRLKIIAGFHVETGHLLIPRNFKPASSEKVRFWDKWVKKDNKKPVKIDIDMLKNQTILAWGGSVVSAEALSSFLELKATVKSSSLSEAKKGNSPVLIVGGQPSADVQTLLATNKFVLVSVDYNQLKSRAPFYVNQEANYEVNGKVVSIPTFGVRALFVGKAFRKESRNQPMSILAGCIDENLPDLADDPDTNPNWESVYELNEQGLMTNWSYFKI